MMKNESLVRVLCIPFCAYYKPGSNEELLCRGAFVVKRLMQSGRDVIPRVATLTNSNEAVPELMARVLCGDCDFREHDCDFAQDRLARPCGGYVLLSRLLSSRTISVEDIR
jgi:hypothetical protein